MFDTFNSVLNSITEGNFAVPSFQDDAEHLMWLSLTFNDTYYYFNCSAAAPVITTAITTTTPSPTATTVTKPVLTLSELNTTVVGLYSYHISQYKTVSLCFEP